jgi:hypothetical protein
MNKNKSKISSFIPVFLLCLTPAIGASLEPMASAPAEDFLSYPAGMPLTAFIISTKIAAEQGFPPSLLEASASGLEKKREEDKGDEQEDSFESDAVWVSKDDFRGLVHYQERFGRIALYIPESDLLSLRSIGWGAKVVSIYQNPWLESLKPCFLQMTAVFYHLKPHFLSPWLLQQKPTPLQSS